MSKYYKKYGFYIEDDPAWAIRERGEDTHGKGDLIFNTCKKILEDKDKSDWAIAAVIKCADLLLEGRRWLRIMDQNCDAKTKLRWRWSNLWKKIVRDKHGQLNKFGLWCEKKGIPVLVKFRTQNSITRDPHIALITASLFLGLDGLVEEVAMPWRQYTPEVFRWRRRLIKPHKLEYVRRLRYLRAKATVLNYER